MSIPGFSRKSRDSLSPISVEAYINLTTLTGGMKLDLLAHRRYRLSSICLMPVECRLIIAYNLKQALRFTCQTYPAM